MAKRLSKGFTLVELLIVVAIIGIIAAIAIPNLITAIQRGKQKRTVGDMRNIGTAIEEYVVDEASCPAASGPVSASPLDSNPGVFRPFYIKVLPTLDGWRTDINFANTGAFAGAFTYSIYSYGKDKAASLQVGDYDNKSFEYDIYFSDGQFSAAPQQK